VPLPPPLAPAGDLAPALVVVGASAGGVEALRDLVGGLPADFPAAVLVVLHVPATASSALPVILDRAGPLPVRHAADGDRLVPGRVLVAQPDHHLVVLGEQVALTRGPQENGHRPAVDVLFRSAARAWGGRVVSVVLSGSLDDGAAGTVAVRSRGGSGLAQSYDEALYDAMPRAAAAAADGVRLLRVAEMPAALVELVGSLPAAGDAGPAPAEMERETQMADLDADAMHDPDRPGVPAGFGCPECAGALFRIEEGRLHRFRCRVGHAWSPDSLLAQQSVALESALWMALRSLEEKAALNVDLSERAAESGAQRTAARFTASADEAWRAAELVRQLVADLDEHGLSAAESPDDGSPDGADETGEDLA